MIVQDISFTSMADALNVREYRTPMAGRGQRQAYSS